MNVHKDNVVHTNIGTNVDHYVMKISAVQQWIMPMVWVLLVRVPKCRQLVSDHSGMQLNFEKKKRQVIWSVLSKADKT